MVILGEVQNDAVRLPAGVHLPDGAIVRLEVQAITGVLPAEYFENTAGVLAGEEFERPAQGEIEIREDW